jgi:murein DD-endopeptidase MepM/ murein hydrolase activator NlpD
MFIQPPLRVVDNWGQGHYGAPRGSRKHKGKDFACYPGSIIRSVKSGIVTKIGYPYDDDNDHDGKPDFTYVEITDTNGCKARYFYVKPCIAKGEWAYRGDVIGETQELGKKYEGITEHMHFEVKNEDGIFFDPDYYSEDLRDD